METTFNDLKNQKARVLTALKKQNAIYLTDAGKLKALIIPIPKSCKIKAFEHPLFGYRKKFKRNG